jgi:hypothetical protein
MPTKVRHICSIHLLLIALFVLAGCAPKAKMLDAHALQSVDSITVAKSGCPPLLKETIGSQTAAITGSMFGAIGGGIGGGISQKMMHDNGKKVQEACGLPDLAQLMLDNFADRAPNELSPWPAMNVESAPLDPKNLPAGRPVLLISVNSITLKNGRGLLVSTTARLTDGENVLWQKQYQYASADHGRPGKLAELEASGGQSLKDEFLFAAEKTVTDFLGHLSGNNKS